MPKDKAHHIRVNISLLIVQQLARRARHTRHLIRNNALRVLSSRERANIRTQRTDSGTDGWRVLASCKSKLSEARSQCETHAGKKCTLERHSRCCTAQSHIFRTLRNSYENFPDENRERTGLARNARVASIAWQAARCAVIRRAVRASSGSQLTSAHSKQRSRAEKAS